MKQIVFLFTLVILVISTQAQLKPDIDRSKIKKSAPAPAPAPPPAPVNKTTAPASTPPLVYNLTSVRVKIRTGSDNKEFPSFVYAVFHRRNPPQGEPMSFSQAALSNEMKINSTTEFGLNRSSNLAGETKLEAFQSTGLRFFIEYRPNLIFDAWKIEHVTLILEFRDQFGNLHPTLGSKEIVFSNANGFLNADYRYLECTTDGYFAPLTAFIRRPN